MLRRIHKLSSANVRHVGPAASCHYLHNDTSSPISNKHWQLLSPRASIYMFDDEVLKMAETFFGENSKVKKMMLSKYDTLRKVNINVDTPNRSIYITGDTTDTVNHARSIVRNELSKLCIEELTVPPSVTHAHEIKRRLGLDQIHIINCQASGKATQKITVLGRKEDVTEYKRALMKDIAQPFTEFTFSSNDKYVYQKLSGRNEGMSLIFKALFPNVNFVLKSENVCGDEIWVAYGPQECIDAIHNMLSEQQLKFKTYKSIVVGKHMPSSVMREISEEVNAESEDGFCIWVPEENEFKVWSLKNDMNTLAKLDHKLVMLESELNLIDRLQIQMSDKQILYICKHVDTDYELVSRSIDTDNSLVSYLGPVYYTNRAIAEIKAVLASLVTETVSVSEEDFAIVSQAVLDVKNRSVLLTPPTNDAKLELYGGRDALNETKMNIYKSLEDCGVAVPDKRISREFNMEKYNHLQKHLTKLKESNPSLSFQYVDLDDSTRQLTVLGTLDDLESADRWLKLFEAAVIEPISQSNLEFVCLFEDDLCAHNATISDVTYELDRENSNVRLWGDTHGIALFQNRLRERLSALVCKNISVNVQGDQNLGSYLLLDQIQRNMRECARKLQVALKFPSISESPNVILNLYGTENDINVMKDTIRRELLNLNVRFVQIEEMQLTWISRYLRDRLGNNEKIDWIVERRGVRLFSLAELDEIHAEVTALSNKLERDQFDLKSQQMTRLFLATKFGQIREDFPGIVIYIARDKHILYFCGRSKDINSFRAYLVDERDKLVVEHIQVSAEKRAMITGKRGSYLDILKHRYPEVIISFTSDTDMFISGPREQVKELLAMVNKMKSDNVSDELFKGAVRISIGSPEFRGYLLGTRGSTLKRLMEKYDVELKMDGNTVVVFGEPENKEEFEKFILSEMDNFAIQEFPLTTQSELIKLFYCSDLHLELTSNPNVRYYIPPDNSKCEISGPVTLVADYTKRIKAELNSYSVEEVSFDEVGIVHLLFQDDNIVKLFPDVQIYPKKTNSTVRFWGTKGSVSAAKEYILKKANEVVYHYIHPEGHVSYMSLIGKSGTKRATILLDHPNAKFFLDKNTNVITICGLNADAASFLKEALLKELDSNLLTKQLEIPADLPPSFFFNQFPNVVYNRTSHSSKVYDVTGHPRDIAETEGMLSSITRIVRQTPDDKKITSVIAGRNRKNVIALNAAFPKTHVYVKFPDSIVMLGLPDELRLVETHIEKLIDDIVVETLPIPDQYKIPLVTDQRKILESCPGVHYNIVEKDGAQFVEAYGYSNDMLHFMNHFKKVIDGMDIKIIVAQRQIMTDMIGYRGYNIKKTLGPFPDVKVIFGDQNDQSKIFIWGPVESTTKVCDILQAENNRLSVETESVEGYRCQLIDDFRIQTSADEHHVQVINNLEDVNLD